MESLIQKIIMPTLVMIWSTSYFLEVSKLAANNMVLIKPVYFLMLILYIITTLGDIKEWKKDSALNQAKAKFSVKDKENLNAMGLVMLAAIIYIVLMKPIGFLISTILFMAAELIILKTNNKVILVVLPIVMSVVVYSVFTQILGIPLPKGILGF